MVFASDRLCRCGRCAVLMACICIWAHLANAQSCVQPLCRYTARSLSSPILFVLLAGSLLAQVPVTINQQPDNGRVPFIVSGVGCSAGTYTLGTTLIWTPG